MSRKRDLLRFRGQHGTKIETFVIAFNFLVKLPLLFAMPLSLQLILEEGFHSFVNCFGL